MLKYWELSLWTLHYWALEMLKCLISTQDNCATSLCKMLVSSAAEWSISISKASSQSYNFAPIVFLFLWVLRAELKALYRSGIHEESCLPAQLLHRKLQQSGLRDGPLIDVQSSLRMQGTEEKRRLLSNTWNKCGKYWDDCSGSAHYQKGNTETEFRVLAVND